MENLPPENVQQYPRPPSLARVLQTIEVVLSGEIIASTTKALRVLETHHAPTYYMPRDALSCDLVPIAGGSFCEWKGRATYFDVFAGKKTAKRAAWSYQSPTDAFRDIAGFIAIYAGLMDACFVGSERVIPQPGDFYGGWVTSNLTGIPKGARGTEHW